MPKAILEFQLPEEQEEFDMARNGCHNLIVLEDMDNYLRNKLKYQELTDEQCVIYQEIRDKLRELRYE